MSTRQDEVCRFAGKIQTGHFRSQNGLNAAGNRGWDTSRVTDMSAMFSDCFVLKDSASPMMRS
ncbi:MAG: hypothetical protein J6A79_08820 [Clostridia bacterium]|nr:hypothetical protein [Clostridia bacterium]